MNKIELMCKMNRNLSCKMSEGSFLTEVKNKQNLTDLLNMSAVLNNIYS